MNTVRKIAKNSIFLLISQIITYILAFIYNIYIARYLGVEGFGILSFAIAFVGIFSVIADLGLSTLTTREVARNKLLTDKYLVNITLIKTFLVIFMFLLIITSINLLNYPAQTIYIIYIISLSVIVGNFSMIFSSIFQAYEKMEYIAFSQVLVSILIFLGVIFSISKNYDVISFALIFLISNIIAFSYNLLICIWKFNIKSLDFDTNFCKITIKHALPLSLAVIFSTIAFRIDTVMLSLMINNIAVGFYTASYKLMEALLFIPSIFSVVVLPIFSNFHISSKESLKSSYEKSFKYLTIVGIPIAFGTTFLANKMILFIYNGEFSQSIIVLQILVWTIPFIFLTYVFKVILISINKQNLLLKIILISMFANIGLNLILIPSLSYIGTSIVTVVTEFISFVLCFYYLSIFVGEIQIKNYILKPTIASIFMVLFLINSNMNLLLIIIISTLIYFAILVVLKTFSNEDISLFKQLFKIKN